jgi:hypothetical protein
MKLTKIHYRSAVYFGVLSFVMYLILGVLQWSLKDTLLAQGIEITAVSTFVTAPVIGAIIGYLVTLLMILVYNFIAKQYPISWEVSKK